MTVTACKPMRITKRLVCVFYHRRGLLTNVAINIVH